MKKKKTWKISKEWSRIILGSNITYHKAVTVYSLVRFWLNKERKERFFQEDCASKSPGNLKLLYCVIYVMTSAITPINTSGSPTHSKENKLIPRARMTTVYNSLGFIQNYIYVCYMQLFKQQINLLCNILLWIWYWLKVFFIIPEFH